MISEPTKQNNTPLVSIVLPTYNRAYILREAIESVLNQTYAAWELIIVDDGSIDETQALVATFQDSRIRYVAHEKNKGLPASRNTGIRHATGPYIANLDSDDTWLPCKLEKEVAVFHTAPNNVGIVYSGYDRTLGDGTVVRLPPKEQTTIEGDLQEEFLTGNLISMQMALVKKEVFTSVGGFDEELPALQDWDLWLRASPSWHFMYIPEVLTVGSVLDDSIANNQTKRRTSRERIFKKHEVLFRAKPDVYAHHAFRLAHAFAIIGIMDKARYYIQKARAMKPRSPRYTFAYILILIGHILHSTTFYKKSVRLFVSNS